MKRVLVVGGSIGVGVLLILVAFSAVVNAQATKATITELVSEVQNKEIIHEKMTFLQYVFEGTNSNWFPGYLLLFLWKLIIYIGGHIIAWLISGYYPYK